MFSKAKNFMSDGSKIKKLKVIFEVICQWHNVTKNVAMQNTKANSKKYLILSICWKRFMNFDSGHHEHDLTNTAVDNKLPQSLHK